MFYNRLSQVCQFYYRFPPHQIYRLPYCNVACTTHVHYTSRPAAYRMSSNHFPVQPIVGSGRPWLRQRGHGLGCLLFGLWSILNIIYLFHLLHSSLIGPTSSARVVSDPGILRSPLSTVSSINHLCFYNQMLNKILILSPDCEESKYGPCVTTCISCSSSLATMSNIM